MRRRTASASAVVLIISGPMAWLSVSAAQAQTKDAPYDNESAARACVHKRLLDLIAQNRPNIAGDAALGECTNGLKAELKERKKTHCEAVSYIGWLIAEAPAQHNRRRPLALSRHVRNLKSALAKLDPQPEPVVEPLPPPTRWVNSSIGQRKRG
jgi:hypothetical protein